MATEQLVKDVGHINGFLASQKGNPTFESMLANQAKVMLARLASAQLTAEQATELSKAFQEGPWSQTQMEQFGEALALQLHSGGVPKSRRPNQTMTCFGSYLTDGDIAVLQDASTHNLEKLQRLAERCFVIGLHLPTEKTTKHIIKTAIDCALSHLYEETFCV